MNNQSGKRVLKKEKPPRKGKALPLILVILVVALVGGYAALCVKANENIFLPNTSIGGVAVGKLTQADAVTRVEEQLPQRMQARSVSFVCAGQEYAVPLTDFSVDIGGEVLSTLNQQRGSFLLGGARYLSALTRGEEHGVSLKLDRTPQMVEQAVETCSDPEAQTTWAQEENRLVFQKGRTGRTVDVTALCAELETRAWKLLSDVEPAEYAPIEVQVTTAPPAEPDFQAIHDQLYMEAADAYLDKETRKIVPSVTGVSFNVDTAAAKLAATPEGGVCTINLQLEEPELTTEILNAKLFADVLGSSSTKCAGPASRWYNINLAVSRVNGTILLPGEEFSYNALAGPYTESGGYQKAGAYVGGKNIDTTAGGICQLSSTLYWSVLKANLEVVERNKHKYNSGYMPVVGTDATVYSDSLDFRFKNDTEFPIKVECYQDKSHYLHVMIHGTDTTGIHGEPYSVTLSTVAYHNTYKPNAEKVPVGGEPVRDTEYARYNGITVEVYQKLVDKDGKTVDTIFLHKDTYSVSNPVYYYNPADAERLGIDTATGLMTLTPVVTPSPSPSTSPSPSPSPSPSADPEPEVTPGTDPTPSTEPEVTPTPDPSASVEPSPSPSTEPAPTNGPGMEPEE